MNIFLKLSDISILEKPPTFCPFLVEIDNTLCFSFLASIKKLPNGIFTLDFNPCPDIPDDVAGVDDGPDGPDGADDVLRVLDLVRAAGPLDVGKGNGGGIYGPNGEAEGGRRANVGKPADIGVNGPRGGGC